MIIFSDVDGVLTDGCYYQNENLEITKGFSTRDFHTINKFSEQGFQFVFLTASQDACTKHKFTSYGLNLVCNCQNKKDAIVNLCDMHEVVLADCIFVGDGPQDLQAMLLCGRSFCPHDASSVVKNSAYVNRLNSCGGRGVIDEMLYRCFKEQYEKILLS